VLYIGSKYNAEKMMYCYTKRAKLSLCPTNYALHYEDVCARGVIRCPLIEPCVRHLGISWILSVQHLVPVALPQGKEVR
jgi:hypothetical protein